MGVSQNVIAIDAIVDQILADTVVLKTSVGVDIHADLVTAKAVIDATKVVVDLGATAAALVTAKGVIDATKTAVDLAHTDTDTTMADVAAVHVHAQSILDDLHTLKDHIHSQQKVTPTGAAGKRLTSAAGAWTAGTIVEILADTGAALMDFHFVNVETMEADGTYEIELYVGAALSEVLIGSVRVVRSTVKTESIGLPITTPLIPINSRISAAVKYSVAAAKYVDISLCYHTY